jgi:NIMA (never in mitosis gene a)-related kinase
LYELCTLKHAFSADNLLGLVFKIVQEKHPPIPTDRYSKDLEDLIEQAQGLV